MLKIRHVSFVSDTDIGTTLKIKHENIINYKNSHENT